MSAFLPTDPAVNPSTQPDQAFTTEELIALWVDLRGAATSCLLAMAIVAGPVHSSTLVELCGYGKTTIKAGLRRLRNHQLARYDRKFQAWSLTDRGRGLVRSLAKPAEKNLHPGPAGAGNPDQGGQKTTSPGRILSESERLKS